MAERQSVRIADRAGWIRIRLFFAIHYQWPCDRQDLSFSKLERPVGFANMRCLQGGALNEPHPVIAAFGIGFQNNSSCSKLVMDPCRRFICSAGECLKSVFQLTHRVLRPV